MKDILNDNNILQEETEKLYGLAEKDSDDVSRYGLAEKDSDDVSRYGLAEKDSDDVSKYGLAEKNEDDISKYGLEERDSDDIHVYELDEKSSDDDIDMYAQSKEKSFFEIGEYEVKEDPIILGKPIHIDKKNEKDSEIEDTQKDNTQKDDTESYESTPKKSKKGKIVISSVLALVVVLAIGGYLNKPNKIEESPISTTPEILNEKDDSLDNMEDEFNDDVENKKPINMNNPSSNNRPSNNNESTQQDDEGNVDWWEDEWWED